MSKVAIKGASTGNSTFTIESPATNTDRTLVLPDNAGTVLTSASALVAANLSGRVPAANAPLGSVIQVVQGSTTTFTQNTSTSFTDTTLSASITPTSTSSKILILISHSLQVQGNTSNDEGGSLRILRGTTVIETVNGILSKRAPIGSGSFGIIKAHVPLIYLDSPNTTSSITYKTQQTKTASAESVISQSGNSPSIITLMEIAA
jgi:hypothetical protein